MTLRLARVVLIGTLLTAAGIVGFVATHASAAHPRNRGHLRAARRGDRHRARAAGALTLSEINTFAVQLATREGDRSPSNVQAVSTNEDTADQLMEPGASRVPGSIPDETAVYLVTMTGHFTAYDAPVTGTSFPTGTVLTVTIDPSTGQVRDLGLNSTRPDLAKAGPVIQMQGG